MEPLLAVRAIDAEPIQVVVKDAAVKLERRTRTKEGYLRASMILAMPGEGDYRDGELVSATDGKQMQGMKIRRTPESVFHPETLESAKLKAVTLDHPVGWVTPDNHRDLAVGQLGSNPLRVDDDKLAIDVMITDPDAIKAVDQGKDRVSPGFEMWLRPVTGQGDITHETVGPLSVNHAALIDRGTGRQGDQVRVLDKQESHKMDPEELKNLIEQVTKGVTESVTEKLPDLVKTAVADAQGRQQADPTTDTPAPTSDAPASADEPTGETADPAPATKVDAQPVGAPEAEPVAAGDQIVQEGRELARVIDQCRPYLAKDSDPFAMSKREMLVEATKNLVTDQDNRSDDYLMGVVENRNRNRNGASDQAGTLHADAQDSAFSDRLGAPTWGIDVRRKMRREGKLNSEVTR